MNIPVGQRRRPFCVFTSAGDTNNVLSWLPSAGERTWDLIIAFYGESQQTFDELASHADIILKMKGSKFQNIKKIFSAQPGLFKHYEYIWVADDDITFLRGSLDHLFNLARDFGFVVSQPSFSSDGRISHPVTGLGKNNTVARIVNFIEVTCPVFRTDYLIHFLDIYDGNLVGWGIDWWFCQYLGSQDSYQFAVIDEVQVLNPLDHQKKGQAREITKLLGDEARKQQWVDTKLRFRLEEFPQQEFAEIRRVDDINSEVKNNLTRVELKLLSSFARCSSHYLEFGIGSNTSVSVNCVQQSVMSVDSSGPLIDKLENYFADRNVRTKPKFLKVDIGETDYWGYPLDDTYRGNWPQYHGDIWLYPEAENADLVLLAGRFRVACFMQAILFAKPDAFILMANFAPRREYHIVREVAREVAAAENLSVFQAFNKRARIRAAEILQDYMFDAS